MKIKANDKLKVIVESADFGLGDTLYALADENKDGCVPVARTLNGAYVGACGPSGGGWFAYRFEVIAPGTGCGIDFDKPLETTEGQPVTIVSTAGRGDYPVLAYLGNSDNVTHFTAEGKYYLGSTSVHDLRNIAPERVVYINVYPHGNCTAYPTRAAADQGASGSRIGCNRVVLKPTYDD